MERGTVRVKCPRTQRRSPALANYVPRTARTRVNRANHHVKRAFPHALNVCSDAASDFQVRQSNLTKNDRKKFNTVLIIEVHARDIIDSFVRDR